MKLLHLFFMVTIFILYTEVTYAQYSQLEKYLAKSESISNPSENEEKQTSDSYNMLFDETILEEKIDPNVYVVGPGDIFGFSMVSSDGYITIPLTISPLGEVLIPLVGTIQVANLLLVDAIQKIKAVCLNKYKNSQVNITLTNIRKFKVKVTGMHNNVGYFVVTPVTRLSELYSRVISSEELDTKLYSTRNIKLHRDNEIRLIDLQKSLILGDKVNDPLLLQGDIIEIGVISHSIYVNGGVVKTGIYEFVENETIYDLLYLAGGFTNNADSSKIELTRFIDDIHKKKIYLNSISVLENNILQPEDHILVRVKKEYKRQTLVTISGEVRYPGEYSIDKNIKTVQDVLKLAGGYTDRADRNRIILNNSEISKLVDIEFKRIQQIPVIDQSDSERGYIKARNRSQKGKLKSYSNLYTDEILNYELSRNDEIVIPERFEYIEVLGAVSFPGRIPLIASNNISDYLQIAGGVTENASKDRYIIKANSGQHILFSKNKTLDSGDIIFIAEKLEYNKWERFKEIMAITGQTAAIIAVIQNALGN